MALVNFAIHGEAQRFGLGRGPEPCPLPLDVLHDVQLKLDR
jgi:hypothetical protein